jgi:hypothetical protein
MMMALPELRPLPPIDQLRRLEAMLADLMPHTPAGVSIEPEWLPQLNGWKLWLTDKGSANDVAFGHFHQQAFDLADKHGIDIDIIPVDVRSWG